MIVTKDGYPLEMIIGKPVKNAVRTIAQVLRRNVDWEGTALRLMQKPINYHMSLVLCRMYENGWIDSKVFHSVAVHFDPYANKAFPLLADSMRPNRNQHLYCFKNLELD